MAETFGVAAGAVTMATAFSACVECFQYIQLGRNFGQDFQTDLLALNCTRLRLTRWGHAVDIYNNPKLGGSPDASAADIQTAKDTLHHILVLFAESEKISKKNGANVKDGETLFSFAPDDDSGDGDSAVMAINNKMKEMAIKRQKEHGFVKTVQWSLYRRSQLRELLQDITRLMENLERLLPGTPSPILSAAAKQEVAQLDDGHSLSLVENAAHGVDPLLETAVKVTLTGHRYGKISVKGKAQVGDAYSSDWQGKAKGASHTYGGVEVDKEGDGRVLIGNKYGGKDFWDE